MAAITVRSLPDDVHADLRAHASAKGSSVEAYVRGILADATKPATGMAEVQQHFVGPSDLLQPRTPASGSRTELWGALRGTVQLAPGTDLAEPVGEAWDAEG